MPVFAIGQPQVARDELFIELVVYREPVARSKNKKAQATRHESEHPFQLEHSRQGHR